MSYSITDGPMETRDRAPKRVDAYINKLYSTIIENVTSREKLQETWEDDEDYLAIEDFDLNVIENAQGHHTDQYEQTSSPPFCLIIRRGALFHITLEFNRDFNPKRYEILLEFLFGPNPTGEKKSKHILRVQDGGNELSWRWGAKIVEVDQRTVSIAVKTSPTCLVGEWQLKIHTGAVIEGNLQTKVAFEVPGFIYILFNPWCMDDPVYMENEREREEYVLTDSGAVWAGAKYNQYSPIPWHFGQFEDVSLFSALLLLREAISGVPDEQRYDPVVSTRALTFLVNQRILIGNWSENFDGGTRPTEWTGSVKILEQFVKSGLEPVKFGQCWVFAGVLNTLLRAVGIPSRSVTNISSAHDTDHTLTIDEVYIKDPLTDKYNPESNGDSIWNFHVWNESWMRRFDLKPGYDGWQACDATPQELSQGRYQCGPMAVKAIHQGEVKSNYDGWFLFGEVNADVVRWYYEYDYRAPNGRKLINVSRATTDVGVAIVTSQLGKPMEAVLLTNLYKAKEDSSVERHSVLHAVRLAVAEDRNDIFQLYQIDPKEPETSDVEFVMNDLERVAVGQPVRSTLSIRNKSHHNRRIVLNRRLYVVIYTGATHSTVFSQDLTLFLKAGEGKQLILEVQDEDYVPHLDRNNMMAVDVIAEVKDTQHVFSNRDTFMVDMPPVEIQAPKIVEKDRSCTVILYFTNPVNVILTDCSLTVEGPGLTRHHSVRIPKEIPGCGSINVKYSFVPKRFGQRTFMACFNSKQLGNCRGVASINVKFPTST